MDCLFQANIGKYYYVDPEFAECYRIVWLWGRSGWNDGSGSSTKWWFCGNWRTFCMWSLLSLWHSMNNGMWRKPYLPIWQNTILLSLSPVLSIIIVLVYAFVNVLQLIIDVSKILLESTTHLVTMPIAIHSLWRMSCIMHECWNLLGCTS